MLPGVVGVVVAAIVVVLTVEGGERPDNRNITRHLVRSLSRIRFYVMRMFWLLHCQYDAFGKRIMLMKTFLLNNPP